MNFRGTSSVWVGALCISLLAACGGGGGGDTSAPTLAAPTNPNQNPVASANSFALNAGYKARLIVGAHDYFDVSGDCLGTANIKIEKLEPASFEVVGVFGAPQVSTPTLTKCNASVETGTTYYNAKYTPIGLTIAGREHALALNAPVDLPVSVKVNDAGTIVTYNVYSDSGKATLIGTRAISYKIEPDTPTTAVFNLITKSFNPSNLLLSTQESRYVIAADGSLTLLTIKVAFENALLTTLVYTKK